MTVTLCSFPTFSTFYAQESNIGNISTINQYFNKEKKTRRHFILHGYIIHSKSLLLVYSNDIDTNLYLFLVSSSNVRNCPAGFLFNALFMIMGQQAQQARQCTMVNNTLKQENTNILITFFSNTINQKGAQVMLFACKHQLKAKVIKSIK